MSFIVFSGSALIPSWDLAQFLESSRRILCVLCFMFFSLNVNFTYYRFSLRKCIISGIVGLNNENFDDTSFRVSHCETYWLCNRTEFTMVIFEKERRDASPGNGKERVERKNVWTIRFRVIRWPGSQPLEGLSWQSTNWETAKGRVYVFPGGSTSIIELSG